MEIGKLNLAEEKERKTMTVKEFCNEYGIGQNKCYELVNSKGFPMFKCGRRVIIIRAKVDEWLQKQIGMHF